MVAASSDQVDLPLHHDQEVIVDLGIDVEVNPSDRQHYRAQLHLTDLNWTLE